MIDHKVMETFDKLYNETYNDILKYVVCNCYNINDIEDIIQNTYIGLYNVLKKNKDISNIKSYLIKIAKNKINDYYRFKYKKKFISLFSNEDKIDLIDNIPSDIDIEKEIIKKEDIDKIWNFLSSKKVVISKVFYLYYYLDLSIKEISRELNITESSVKHYLYRTLKELNNYLEVKS